MSKNDNDCDIVFDLLPLYLDGRTGQESNVFVKEHLAGCAECREVYRLMSAEFPEKNAAMQGADKNMRKRKRFTRTTKRLVILLVGLIGYVCLLAGIVVYTFWTLANGVL